MNGVSGVSRITIGCQVSGRGSKGFSPCAINDSVNGSSSGFSSSGSKGSSSSSSGSCSISSCGSFGSSTSVKTSSEVPELDLGSECNPNVPLRLDVVLSCFGGVGCRCYQHNVLCFSRFKRLVAQDVTWGESNR